MRTVLVIDDDDDFRDNILDILEGLGYRVLSAKGCSEALRIVEEREPDVTLLDIKLPDGLGTDLLRDLKKRNADAICIIMTAFADLKTALDALESGAFQYLRKPVQPKELLHQLERAFETIRLRREKENAEQQLRESEKTIRSLLDTYPELALLFDGDGSIVSANRRAVDFLTKGGSSPDNLSIEDFMSVQYREKMFHAVRDVGQTKKPVLFEETANGRVFETFVAPVLDGSVPINHFAVFSRDVTEIRKTEEERHKLEAILAQSQKMDAIGNLSGGMAHDFNNLLQSILGYTQILLLDPDIKKSHAAQLTEIQKASQMAANLTRQLLTFSRNMESSLRPTNLNHVVQQIENLLQHTIPKMVAIEIIADKDLRVVSADPGQIEQILLNLAINARDAMPEGGKFTIQTENITIENGSNPGIPGIVPGDYVMIVVSDTGCGMEREVLDHMFEPFFTTKEVGKGSGLGLAVVFGIVKAHNGYITCESEPGRGTSFRIHIPAISVAADSRQREEKEMAIPRGTECILVVDDDRMLRDLAAAMLGNFGYRTILAADGENAIELYKEHKKDISLVILDMIMPGIGGKRCLDELLRFDSDVKVLIASGFIQDETIDMLMKAGARGFIAKPYKIGDMLQVVRSHLDG